eukprot:Em0017g885a
MKGFILVAMLAVAAAFDFTDEWEEWKKTHNKVYGSEGEELSRHIIWEAKKKYIDEHNAHQKGFGFTLAINKFSDLSSQEFKKLYTGLQGDILSVNAKPVHFGGRDLPPSIDWRDKGYVTPVKDQGQCGSCWAFSTVGSLEGQHFNATGTLVSLSEQNLVDCSKANDGCNGGRTDVAMEYVIKNGGIDTEESYPYKAHNEKCNFNASNIGANCSSYNKIIPAKSEASLQDAVATVGPISVCIDAAQDSFQSYSGGVYDEPKCSQTALDHCVLAVGYGSTDTQDYWIVKNSWGTDWGQEGYIWMSRNKSNQCGIATAALYPTVDG